uniref:DNA helicase Pif1-like 2B domain-containing protein n=1 Tax=Nelumbo nucifera TaxID=4432 RepID=A0A822Z658_NELNU|nr:TPA_asm: hypothetical protein HUJ06_013201 [Nelumbo nucifera]
MRLHQRNALHSIESADFTKRVLNVRNGNRHIQDEGNGVEPLVHSIYPDLQMQFRSKIHLCEQVIPAPTNGSIHSYRSTDTMNVDSSQEYDLYPQEFLNSLKYNGLQLKIGTPIMLLHNLDQSNGLWNMFDNFTPWHKDIEAKIITRNHIGETICIPRIITSPTNTGLPFNLRRRQFSLKLAFDMAINKRFTHGQLYVAISRVPSKRRQFLMTIY